MKYEIDRRKMCHYSESRNETGKPASLNLPTLIQQAENSLGLNSTIGPSCRAMTLSKI